MDLALQVWGGGLYLLNKVFFALAEGRDAARKRALRIAGWCVYLLGVPAWVIILVGKHDWIAASIEAGGIPAMLYGLYNAARTTGTPSKVFETFASRVTYASLAIGFGYSLYDYGGLVSLSQLLEIGVMVGFLMGSILLAKQHSRGWLFFLLMNASMAALMELQGKPLLTAQQLCSLCFVAYGYRVATRAAQPRNRH